MKNYCIIIIALLFVFSCKQTPEIIPEYEPEIIPESIPEVETVQRTKITMAGFNMSRLQDAVTNVPQIIDALVEVVSKYDVVIIQGIKNNNLRIVQNLNEITNFNNVCDYNYDYIVSSRKGRAQSEQGAVLYNSFALELIDAVVLDSPDRPYNKQPFVVFFRITETGQVFSIFCLETSPNVAMEEMEYLEYDFDQISAKYNEQDTLLLSDLNQNDNYIDLEILAFPENYSITVLNEISPSYNTFDTVVLPPKFDDETAFSGTKYFEDIIDYQALNISVNMLSDIYLLWMTLYF